MFLVLFALMLVALFAMVAIVIDLSAVRTDRRTDRNAADAAATAGALDLEQGSNAACTTAWNFAVRNLGLTPPAAPCGTFPVTCAGDIPAAVGTVGGYTIRIKNPVLGTDALMRADTAGGDIAQSEVAVTDGVACDRVAVEISYTRKTVFAKVVGITKNTSTVHSVARFTISPGTGGERPALVALEQTLNCAVDSGPGTIHALATGQQPALIYTDSDGTGPSCSGGSTTVFSGKNGGKILADPGGNGVAGELGYFAPNLTEAFDPQPTYDENGPALPPVGATKVRLSQRITRRPLDKVYHCGSVVPATPVVPGCTTGSAGTDFINSVETRYGNLAVAPTGFSVYPNPALPKKDRDDQCAGSPANVTFAATNWYINCATFEVGGTVEFRGGDVVFAGNVSIKSGGKLNFNSLAAADSTVVIRGEAGLTTASGGWAISWPRTVLIMDNALCPADPAKCGHLAIQGGDPSSWTPPEAGSGAGLIFWSETSASIVVQGNPNFFWVGVFAAPRSLFDVQGSALVDASNVQLWVRAARVGNTSAELRLRADPNRSITTSKAGSVLIR